MGACVDEVFLTGWGFHSRIWSVFVVRHPNALFLDLNDFASADLNAIADELDRRLVRPVQLIGWSFGGLIALQFADRFPAKVRRLVLVGSTPKFIATPDWVGISPIAYRRFLSMASKSNQVLRDSFLQWVNYPNTDARIRKYLTDSFSQARNVDKNARAMLHLLFSADMRAIYQRLSMPILHVLGEEDAITKIDNAALIALNPLIQLLIIPRAGHAAFVTHKNLFEKYLQ